MVTAMHGKALRKLWTGVCTIYVREPVTDETTGKTIFQEVPLIEGEPCRLSHKTVTTAGEKDNAAPVIQTTELFITNEITIPPGSKIVVTQNGVTGVYQQSGKPAVYSAHQEVIVDIFKEWA